jgi:hypothetical protein
MAKRTPRTNSSTKRVSIARLVERDVAAKIAAKRAARERQHRTLKEMERLAPARLRSEFKQHGFQTTPKGVLVDGPRNTRRDPLPGARVELHKGGVVKTRVGQRVDFIYGLTKAEKKRFLRDPEAMEKEIRERLRKMFPTLRKVKPSKIESRLQWGAYQATKEFAPSYFTAKYFATVSPEDVRKVGKKRAKPRADKLTGFHFVVHIPKASKARKRKEGKHGKKKGKKK